MQKPQRLYWSIGMALRWLGLTLDEWFILLIGVIPGIFILNDGSFKLGLMLILLGFCLCWIFKKFKKISENFLIKSWMLSQGILPKPSRIYPNLLGQKVGK